MQGLGAVKPPATDIGFSHKTGDIGFSQKTGAGTVTGSNEEEPLLSAAGASRTDKSPPGTIGTGSHSTTKDTGERVFCLNLPLDTIDA